MRYLFRPAFVIYPSLCSTCVTCETPCHDIGQQLLPPNPVTTSVTDLRELFLLSGVFTLHSCCFQGFPGSRQFNLKVNRASCWSSKHNPSPTIYLNPQKIYKGRFYLSPRAGQSQIINLYKQLVLRNFSLEMFASYGVWTLFTIGEHVKSFMFYPFGHRAL